MTHQMTKEQMEKLSSMQPDFHAVIQRLHGAVASDILEKIQSMQETLNTVLAPYNQDEEDNWQENYEALSAIADEHDLTTVWSMAEVSATQMNDKIPFSIQSFQYHKTKRKVSKTLNKTITWLDAWKLVNPIILANEGDHIFIEAFNCDEMGNVTVQTGS